MLLVFKYALNVKQWTGNESVELILHSQCFVGSRGWEADDGKLDVLTYHYQHLISYHILLNKYNSLT